MNSSLQLLILFSIIYISSSLYIHGLGSPYMSSYSLFNDLQRMIHQNHRKLFYDIDYFHPRYHILNSLPYQHLSFPNIRRRPDMYLGYGNGNGVPRSPHTISPQPQRTQYNTQVPIDKFNIRTPNNNNLVRSDQLYDGFYTVSSPVEVGSISSFDGKRTFQRNEQKEEENSETVRNEMFENNELGNMNGNAVEVNNAVYPTPPFEPQRDEKAERNFVTGFEDDEDIPSFFETSAAPLTTSSTVSSQSSVNDEAIREKHEIRKRKQEFYRKQKREKEQKEKERLEKELARRIEMEKQSDDIIQPVYDANYVDDLYGHPNEYQLLQEDVIEL